MNQEQSSKGTINVKSFFANRTGSSERAIEAPFDYSAWRPVGESM